MVFRVESAAVRNERMKRAPVLYVGVHETCVRETDAFCPTRPTPITRRQARAMHKASDGKGGLLKPSRSAWWCHRCNQKVTAKDKVVYVAAT